jgi:hypothetical protein
MGAGTGSGHLWTKEVTSAKKPGFFDKMQNHPIRSKEWQDYEIKGTIDQEAQQIIIGAFLNQTGELGWIIYRFRLKMGIPGKRCIGNPLKGNRRGGCLRS